MAMTGRFYTLTRRIQQLIGKMPDGTAIWGGPYTITQVVTTVVLVIALYFGLGLFGLTVPARATFAVIIGATIGWTLGKVPTPRRPIMSVFEAFVSMLIHSKTGKVGSTPIEAHRTVREGMARARRAEHQAKVSARTAERAKKRVKAPASAGDMTAVQPPETAPVIVGGAARLLAVSSTTGGGISEEPDHGDS